MTGEPDVDLAARQQALVDEFLALDLDGRYRAIIERGRRHPPLAAEHKVSANQLRGCASLAWFRAWLDGRRLRLEGEAEAIVSNGLMALMIGVYDGAAPAQVLAHPPTFIERIGLNASLSGNRANGLAAMAKQITVSALAFRHLLEKQEGQRPTSG